MISLVRAGRGTPILMYHGVSPQRGRRFREFVTSPEAFEAQMIYLAEQRFRVCGVSEFVEGRAESSGGPALGLTFDDAFQELLTFAVPVLRRLGFRATVYVPTAFIGSSSRWLERAGESNRPLLGGDELRELAANGIELGAHSHTHPALDVLTVAEARAEVETSKEVLEDVIGLPVHTFAYPFGYESPAVRALVADAGYSSACRVNYSLSTVEEDVYGLSRLPVAGDLSLEAFGELVHGRRSLWPQKARALAWRPVRRSLARIRPRRNG